MTTYQKGTQVYFTKYSLNRIAELSEDEETCVESVIGEGTYYSPAHSGYHSVWVAETTGFETVSERDLHLTKEAASSKVLDYIQFRKKYVAAQMKRLDDLEGLFRSLPC